jgi:ABC-2 type transport system permease protein
MSTLTLTRPERSLPRLALHARLVANETGKGLLLTWRRRGMMVTFLVMLITTYLLVSLLVGGGQLVRPLQTLTLPALLAVAVAITASVQGTGDVAEEINGGTLEQSQLRPAPPELQVLGRLAALAVEGLAVAAVLGVGFTAALGLRYHVAAAALLPALLTVADALGYGLVLAGLTIRVRSIGAITHVFNMVVQFFGGMMVPVALFPPALETFTRFVPTTLGVQALNTTLAGHPLSATWTDGTLPWLVVHAAISLALGWVVYSVNIRRARREGGLR